ncbi:MAG TPA: hypothetical protein VM030_00050 [Acidimicrobiales bacterium]|nr:hypothetical protein [Acidimicrobiales bacterium]
MEQPVTRVLGIDVGPELLRSWVRWLAPDPQPFFVTDPEEWGIEGSTGTITPELRDTYCLWRVGRSTPILWLSEERFSGLPRSKRAALVREQAQRTRGAVPTVRAWQDLLDPTVLRAQADGHRFVWWPSLLTGDAAAVLTRQVSERRLPSRHEEVPETVWRACADALPAARSLAGTFPAGSKGCCFSTVLEAVGADSTGACDSTEPFAKWLDDACRPGGDDHRPGTVLAWRAKDGAPVHAAVSIGDGWALEKPSQDWHSPRAVVTVTDVVRTSRMAGQRLERHTVA